MHDIKLPVLEKNDRWSEHVLKLTEEYNELLCAFLKEDSIRFEDVIEETLDLIQVCIGILDKLDTDRPGIVRLSAMKHIEKLHSRGWKFKKWLYINED
ncbi:hypothetical protein KQI88_15845 [Alkaliphilus sp. MSJ-5]|uniref:NTP pyrophosphohydrolase MazG putative catalytic core domain-containing protein n=1 Tax=Alkaliphilus flagellatus TaxID=2841507 RepID=A0ABS6G5W8_9FIRM|nr:hypothetical protein [Alkaliphilus flagellatus]MBU5677890.1 hypothetical protein [Alkaliphilus flagellatus]